MALIKSKELENGVTLEYWVAQPTINMVSKQTDVLMLGYKNKEARDSGKNFIIRERVPSLEGIYLTGEQVYTGVKNSRMVEETPAIEEVKDEEGNVITPAQEAVMKETNWFADAEDC